MSRASVCMALWAILALAVFADVFDWQTRQAGFAFVHSQQARRQQGLPLDTIDNGFRPLVRGAALDAAAWAVPILVTGIIGSSLVARRATTLSESARFRAGESKGI